MGLFEHYETLALQRCVKPKKAAQWLIQYWNSSSLTLGEVCVAAFSNPFPWYVMVVPLGLIALAFFIALVLCCISSRNIGASKINLRDDVNKKYRVLCYREPENIPATQLPGNKYKSGKRASISTRVNIASGNSRKIISKPVENCLLHKIKCNSCLRSKQNHTLGECKQNLQVRNESVSCHYFANPNTSLEDVPKENIFQIYAKRGDHAFQSEEADDESSFSEEDSKRLVSTASCLSRVLFCTSNGCSFFFSIKTKGVDGDSVWR